ncbi:hypothetical protein HPB52_022906 [Rhipicephalus sanguineus]|uniref:Uncharacterized protein n=1 Tax=Rhipicephalus sanguineus TaxID=34632 RepID=A0A9D4T250_RHISA|nr:hypothetical protein HPB52_022906 [Rhipicephalus sanguineus]
MQLLRDTGLGVVSFRECDTCFHNLNIKDVGTTVTGNHQIRDFCALRGLEVPLLLYLPPDFGRYGGPQTWNSKATILDSRIVEAKWCVLGQSQPFPQGRPDYSVKSEEAVGGDESQH